MKPNYYILNMYTAATPTDFVIVCFSDWCFLILLAEQKPFQSALKSFDQTGSKLISNQHAKMIFLV